MGTMGLLPSEPGILRLLCWLETKVTIDVCLALYPSPLCCRGSTVQDLEVPYQGVELSCWHHGMFLPTFRQQSLMHRSHPCSQCRQRIFHMPVGPICAFPQHWLVWMILAEGWPSSGIKFWGKGLPAEGELRAHSRQ